MTADAYRVLVTGSRDWPAPGVIRGALAAQKVRAFTLGRPMTVVHGAAQGADSIAHAWARGHPGVAVERHRAKWRQHGIYNPQAGLVRNRLMVGLGADICLAFVYRGSRGASHCAQLAEEAGIPVQKYEIS